MNPCRRDLQDFPMLRHVRCKVNVITTQTDIDDSNTDVRFSLCINIMFSFCLTD